MKYYQCFHLQYLINNKIWDSKTVIQIARVVITGMRACIRIDSSVYFLQQTTAVVYYMMQIFYFILNENLRVGSSFLNKILDLMCASHISQAHHFNFHAL
jgi:hypothetical protein